MVLDGFERHGGIAEGLGHSRVERHGVRQVLRANRVIILFPLVGS
jgi:hypothetical protein